MAETAQHPVNAFMGRTKPPAEPDLAAALGPALPAWHRLLDDLEAYFDVSIREWKSYAPKWGWSLRASRKSRTIVWFVPLNGNFDALFILGEKAVRAARTARLSHRLLKKVNEATKYPEGRLVRLAIRGERDLADVRKLAAIKVAN